MIDLKRSFPVDCCRYEHCLVLFLFVGAFLMACMSDDLLSTRYKSSVLSDNGHSSLYFGETIEKKSACVHPQVDYFEPAIMALYKNPLVCNGKPKNLTMLHNGRLLSTNPDEHECWGRCHTFKSGNSTFAGQWYHTNENYTFPCDIVESRCSPKNQSIMASNFFFMHTQLIEIPDKKEPKNDISGKQYNVFFIIVDSQAHSQLFRNLNKTTEFLLRDLEAVPFPYLNRVGAVSRPNGFALLYGAMLERVDRTAYNMPSLEPETKWKNACERSLDNETMIINEFGDYGYVTNHVADWYRNVDYGCVMTDDKFADHTYTPYAMHYEFDQDLIRSMQREQCIHRHQHALEYLGQFMDSYKGKPKMAFTWMSHVGHNTERGSQDADLHLLELFRNHKDTLDESFVIFGGDHGLRFTDAINTKIGSLDVNNPALVISVPKELRKNTGLMNILKANAGELQTHYDTRATLLDILKYQPNSNFNDRAMKYMEGEMGHSLLREQPKPRSCLTLPIPLSYCICEKTKYEDFLKRNPKDAQLIGQNAINTINRRLKENGIDSKCRQWIFKKTIKLVQPSVSPLEFQGSIMATNNRSLQAEINVKLTGPSQASLDIISLDRIDIYNKAGSCVARDFEPWCDCM